MNHRFDWIKRWKCRVVVLSFTFEQWRTDSFISSVSLIVISVLQKVIVWREIARKKSYLRRSSFQRERHERVILHVCEYVKVLMSQWLYPTDKYWQMELKCIKWLLVILWIHFSRKKWKSIEHFPFLTSLFRLQESIYSCWKELLLYEYKHDRLSVHTLRRYSLFGDSVMFFSYMTIIKLPRAIFFFFPTNLLFHFVFLSLNRDEYLLILSNKTLSRCFTYPYNSSLFYLYIFQRYLSW